MAASQSSDILSHPLIPHYESIGQDPAQTSVPAETSVPAQILVSSETSFSHSNPPEENTTGEIQTPEMLPSTHTGTLLQIPDTSAIISNTSYAALETQPGKKSAKRKHPDTLGISLESLH